ncbi:MAG: 3'-5' exonuclease [Deltaproteobacteria bacterium]|nr:MAG: 3'-5' exonuclease [Deltaproteobacteria bacterium]
MVDFPRQPSYPLPRAFPTPAPADPPMEHLDQLLQRPIEEARFAAFDLETTSTDTRVARIIEIGVAVFENGRVVDRWQQLVDPEETLDPKITELTGISEDDLRGQPVLRDVLDTLLDLLAPQPLLAYNHAYDLGVLQAELARCGRTAEFPPCLDPLPFCWRYLRKAGRTRNARLGTVCEHLGIPLEDAHRADHDAEAAGRVLLALPGIAELPPTLRDFLGLQAALHQAMEEEFARFRDRDGKRSEVSLNPDEVVIELGAAFLYGDEHDPIRALYRRVPDLRG